MESRTRMVIYVFVCMFIGFTCSTLYYYPAYDDMRIQRNDIAQELCNVEHDRDELRIVLRSSESELTDLKVGYDSILKDRNLKRDQLDDARRKLSETKDSYDRLGSEYTRLGEEYSNQHNELNRVKDASTLQQKQIDQIGGMMQESYNKGYADGSSGSSSNDDFIWDLIKGGLWLLA